MSRLRSTLGTPAPLTGVVGVFGGVVVGGGLVGSVGGLPVALPLSFTQYSTGRLPKPSFTCLLLKFFPPAWAMAGPCEVTSPGRTTPTWPMPLGFFHMATVGWPALAIFWASSADTLRQPLLSPCLCIQSTVELAFISRPLPGATELPLPSTQWGISAPMARVTSHRKMLQKVSLTPSPLESRGV